jgi:hypothetical protein
MVPYNPRIHLHPVEVFDGMKMKIHALPSYDSMAYLNTARKDDLRNDMRNGIKYSELVCNNISWYNS